LGNTWDHKEMSQGPLDVQSYPAIYTRVLGFIREPNPTQFEELALGVFRYQFAHVPVYRAFCLSRDADWTTVSGFSSIPFASTLAFKYAEVTNDEGPVLSNTLTFKTSGTTKGYGSRGVHRVPYPQIYRASAMAHLERMLFPEGRRMKLLVLHPTAERMPESSLSWMISWCIEEFGTISSVCVATPQALDCESAVALLRLSERSGEPVGLLGTTAAFARLFEALRTRPIRLPTGSRLMDTGGAKGQTVPLKDYEVRELAATLIGIEPKCAINEYGMTELCSQLYDSTPLSSPPAASRRDRMKLPPPWMRPVALDPKTLCHLEDRQIGLMGFFDLANVGSISAIMTEDFGFTDNGEVAILGRAAASEARGCGLAIEQFAAEAAQFRRLHG
jgi:Acyl-protein synthetase, LuxE